MKKGLIIGLIIVVVLLGFLFYQNYQKKVQVLSPEQILDIVKPQINSYCQRLNEKGPYSDCLICGGGNYVYVQDFEGNKNTRDYRYIIEDEGKYYLVTFQVPLIAGRNDRPAGSSKLVFKIDKEGNLLESDIPEISKSCF